MKTPSSTTTAPARFLLLGDSHAGPIGRAARAAGLPFDGGPLGAGREFTDDFFEPRDADVVFRSPEAEQHYRGFLRGLQATELGAVAVPVVSTLGLSAHFVATADNWQIYRGPNGLMPGFLSSALFGDIVRASVRAALAFYRHALGLGLRVLAVMPPQRVPAHADPLVFMAAQDVIREALTGLGVEMVDLRARTTDEHGFQRPELCEPDDAIHGNLAFGRLILAELLERGL
ncbi:hypothetical protein [Kitasatospora acidiphila]|uniref:hypothetical protein n=1 Tax=Kitasatospora acidiphila TaxID=2567942 RepID=UPI0015F11F74|nr:hypothetical protein [Kitasatospora acidiphila]